jgi:hypothetical protein
VGTDPRYATIALRAIGESPVQWFVDGRAWRAERWPLVPGPHTFRAVGAHGESDEVVVLVQ